MFHLQQNQEFIIILLYWFEESKCTIIIIICFILFISLLREFPCFSMSFDQVTILNHFKIISVYCPVFI